MPAQPVVPATAPAVPSRPEPAGSGTTGQPAPLPGPSATPERNSPLWQILVAVAVLVIGALFSPLDTALGSWIEDALGLGKAKGQVTAMPVLHPCDQRWAMPAGQAAEATEAYRRKRDDAWEAEGLAAWLKAHGAVAQGTFTLDVDVSTDSAEKAVLHDILVKVTRREDVPALAPFLPACGGPGFYYSFGVPLHELPVGRAVSVKEMHRKWPAQVALPATETGAVGDNGATERARPLELPLNMSVEDPESLRIKAFTERGLCEWELQLVWAVAGEEPHTETVDFDGDPFRTAPSGKDGAQP